MIKTKTIGRPRSRDVENRILDSAAEMVSKVGYMTTSIEKIAENGGVSKASIYRRWSSKVALMMSAYCRLVPEEVLNTEESTFDKELRHLLQTLFARYRDTSAGLILVGLIAEFQSDSEAVLKLKQSFISERKLILTRVFERAIQRDELSKNFNKTEACDLVTAMIWHRLLVDRNALNSKFIQNIVNTLLKLGN